MTAAAQQARVTPASAGKKNLRTRDATGRFTVGCAPGPGRRPTDPTLKALAAADRERNFEFIRGMRDDRKMDPELRFEAAKLLAQYSDGKPSLGMLPNGPLVNVNLNGASPAASPASDIDAVVELAGDDGSMPPERRDRLLAGVFASAERAAARVAERRAVVAVQHQPASTAIPERTADAAAPAIAPPSPPGEATMSAADLEPQELPAATQAARDRWLAARARGDR
jgi:hypothetical protein